MEAKAVDAEAIFRAFTACGKDPNTLLLDVRPQKDFKKGHVSQAFNPRLATNGKFLADYSQAQYSMPWSQDCWYVVKCVTWSVCEFTKHWERCMTEQGTGTACHAQAVRMYSKNLHRLAVVSPDPQYRTDACMQASALTLVCLGAAAAMCMLLLSWFLLALCRRWGKPVIVYGPPSLAKDHPVIKFLADQQRCASLSFYKQGCVEQRVQGFSSSTAAQPTAAAGPPAAPPAAPRRRLHRNGTRGWRQFAYGIVMHVQRNIVPHAVYRSYMQGGGSRVLAA